MEYILHLLILAGIYTMLAQSLNLTAGYAKIVSLSHAGFYGIGAYTAALFAINTQMPFLFVLLIAMIINLILSFIVSFIALRTIDAYFIFCTLALQAIILSLMNNMIFLTRGPLGISGISPIQIFKIEFDNRLLFFLLTSLFVALVFMLLNWLTKSSFGRALISLSEDEIFTQSIGKNVKSIKIIAYTTGATIAAIPGVLYAHYISFIDPSSFTLNESIFILSIVIIGGMNKLWGSLFGALILILLPEALRFLGIPNTMAANFRQIICGLVLLFIMYKYSMGYVEKKKWRKNG